MITEAELNRTLDKAKVGILVNGSIFLSTIIFSLKHIFTTDVLTAGVDGITMFINPDFFMSLTPEERIFLMCHEGEHVALDHINRGMDLDKVKFNKAADYVINYGLVEQGYAFIEGGLLDKQYADMFTEQVYLLLPDEPEDSTYDLDIMAVPGGTKEEKKENIKKIESAIIRAATQSKAGGDPPGTIPGEVQVYLDELLNPVLPWTTLLQNYMTSYNNEDTSWNVPNRRYLSQGYYLPGSQNPSLGNIAVAVDTSGSVSDEEFKTFISEIEDIRTSLNPDTLTILDFDTEIKNVHILESTDNIASVKFYGRGGTDLEPVMEYFRKNPTELLIVFSDLHCNRIQDPLECDVIWICIDNPSASVHFGKLIHMSTTGNNKW